MLSIRDHCKSDISDLLDRMIKNDTSNKYYIAKEIIFKFKNNFSFKFRSVEFAKKWIVTKYYKQGWVTSAPKAIGSMRTLAKNSYQSELKKHLSKKTIRKVMEKYISFL